MYLLIGPFVAAVGLVAVFFVMRHKSVQEKSMYSARRSQIERKVRAARQRTLAPTSKHSEQEAAQAAQAATFAAPGMEAKTAIPTVTWGPPAARPEAPPPPPPLPQEQQAWEVGPTVPPPPPSMPPPSPPAYEPSAPTYAPPPEEVWNPAPAETFAPAPPEPMAEPAAAAQVSTPAGGGASWSIVGDAKDVAAEAADGKKDKKDKKDKEKRGATASWQLAAGELPGDEGEDVMKKPSAAIAIAQYAVLVVGLVMVLVGVVVMVANSHVT